jgi:hypothetical protein
MKSDKATEIIQRFGQLEGERNTWERTWQDIIDYCLPNRESVIGHDTKGEIRNWNIYDSTANKSLLRLASALNNMLTNQSSEWFALTTDDEQANELPEVKEWLDKMTTEIRDSFEASNFYTEVHEMYIDLASIGTGVLLIEPSDSPDNDIYFSCRHIREIFTAENHEGMVDTVFRKFRMTARQMVQKWGDDVSDEVKELMKKEPDDERDIIHAVYPREDYDSTKKDSKNMPFASCWLEYDTNFFLAESGYETFPYVVPRWSKASGEKYGRSPALSGLPDIKTVNAMVHTLLKTGQKIADPPLQVPDEIVEVDLTPGGINYYDANLQGRIEPINIGANLPFTDQLVDKLRASIRDTFYVTQLQLIEHKNMTAEEVRIRTDENLRILGPTFGRLTFEFMEKLIGRVINILQYSFNPDGSPRLPQPPEVIQGKKLRLKYLSPLAKAQKHTEFRSINNIVATALSWSQIKPDVLDNINFDKAIRKVGELDGIPKGIFNDEDQVAQGRQARAEQQMQAQQMQMEDMASDIRRKDADAVKKVAQAKGE